MKTRILSLLLLFALILPVHLTAQDIKAPQRAKENRARMEMMQKRRAMQRASGPQFFTEEQKESMKALRLEAEKSLKPLKNQLREMMARQRTLTTEDNADMKAINKNIDRIAETKAEMGKIRAAQHQKFRSLLTEEQRLKFDARQGNRKNRGDFRTRRGIHSNRGRMQNRSGA